MVENTPDSFTYSVTQTLHPRYYSLNPVNQLLKTFSNVESVIKQFNPIFYEIVAELTKKSNIHYHFSIKCTHPFDDFSRVYMAITKPLGFCKIDLCHDIDGWNTYMHKDICQTLNLLNRCNILPVKIKEEIKIKHIRKLQKVDLLNKSVQFKKLIKECYNICHSLDDDAPYDEIATLHSLTGNILSLN